MGKPLSLLNALVAAAGLPQLNILRIAAATSDGEVVVIGSQTFEFDTDSTITAGNIAVDISGGATAGDSRTAIVTAMNANGLKAVALVGEFVVVALVGKGTDPVACTETMAGVNNAWENATTYGGGPPDKTHKVPVQLSRAVIASEATALAFAMAFPYDVLSAIVSVRTSAGVTKAFDGVVALDDNLVTIHSNGVTDLATGDVVTISAVLDIPAP